MQPETISIVLFNDRILFYGINGFHVQRAPHIIFYSFPRPTSTGKSRKF